MGNPADDLAEARAEVQRLNSENRELKKTIKKLEARVKELTPQKDKNVVHEELDELEQTLLSFLASVKKSDHTPRRIAAAIQQVHPESQMTELKANVYLRRLSDRDLVALTLDMGSGPSLWHLTHRGEEYVVVHKLQTTLLPDPEAQPSNPKGHPCDHCGSTRLRRTGSRPDATFGDAGIKEALYKCLDCGKESGFTNDQASV